MGIISRICPACSGGTCRSHRPLATQRPHSPEPRIQPTERGGWIDAPVEDVFAVPTLYLYRSRPLLLSWFQKKERRQRAVRQRLQPVVPAGVR